ncbi:MAG TPA: hypothetical protein PLI05_05545 [Methanotrichaceae archaeon]|nr:hypothetical protein [Methanotrichaceae archaeon]HQF16513.1 hypothetical protein [Methanotrichaceae archaeon]HQI91116.1 hypothetical protein [Methanotrichaceae archaeon]HQJ28493.1 hypothetical protein [Methanotrichaceae archaeon]
MRCEICGREADRFWRVNHRDRGAVRICSTCLQSERTNLEGLGGGCSCFR